MANSSEMNFKGYLKLKKDPKGAELTIKNMILREEVNQNAEWMYGIAIYVGNQCKSNLIQ